MFVGGARTDDLVGGGSGAVRARLSPASSYDALTAAADEIQDPAVARRAFMVCMWLAGLSILYSFVFVAGWQLLDNNRLGVVAVLALVGGGVDLVCARLVHAGRLQTGVLLFAANVLAVIGAIGVLVPEEVTTVVVASMMPVVFTMQFVAGWPARVIASAGLLVAFIAMVVRFGLDWSSGLDPDVLAWVDISGGMLALTGLVVMFVQARAVLEARSRLLINAQLEAEQRRVGLEVARRSATLQDEFVNSVSHELRTPLTSILGYAEMMLDHDDRSEVPETQRRMLSVVLANARRLDGLVADLLDVGRLAPGTVRIEPEALDVVRLVDGVASALEPLLSAKGQRVVVESSGSSVPLVADPRRLEQVVTNLVSNAHKYSPTDARIEVEITVDDAEVAIAVSDTGIGMTPEECARLFTRFFRADRDAVRNTPGTGLGLVITRSIVELHGGRVGVVSELGSGSTFTVYLPREHAGPASRLT